MPDADRILKEARQCIQGGRIDEFRIEVDGGGCFTLGLPRHPAARLVWWPKGVETRFRIAPVSSRTGRRLDLKQHWFAALRTAAIRCDGRSECLCVSAGTAPAEAVSRSAELFGVPLLTLDVADGDGSLGDWVRGCVDRSSDVCDVEVRAEVSPPLVGEDELAVPAADRVLMEFGERIVVLESRSGGNVERLLEQRLRQRDAPAVLWASSAGVNPSPPKKLAQLGAVAWLLAEREAGEGESAASAERMPLPEVPDGPLGKPDDWLFHWTRPATGPWPDQTPADFLDELILGCDSADRSALAALMRILKTGKIEGSVARTGEVETVSLTAVPLAEFRKRRVYRKHRRRFDFESWGIAIRRSAVEQLGGQPVKYLSGEEADSGGRSSDRFSQPHFDASGKIDWSVEREWRIAAPVLLSDVSPADLCVFVDRLEDATVVARQFGADVVVVPG